MTRKLLFRILLLIGFANTLILFISALIGQNAYGLANNLPHFIINIVLGFIPLGLTGIAAIWWLVDVVFKQTNRVNYCAIALSGILADAVFVIGSLFFV